ncbi:MAG: alcohol dehydrogenase catalytic domain-containing protein [Acidimicrobiia bacterium]
MRAIQIHGPGKVGLAELPLPKPSVGEELVRVAVAGVCATDQRLARQGTQPGRVIGHEIGGWLADQTPVGVHPDIGCGHCRFCRLGFENRCPDRKSIGIDRDGGLAEYVVVPAQHLTPLGRLPLKEAPLLEPFACCLHAVDLLNVGPGDTGLVVGAGTMGVLAMWALQSRGLRVVVSQRSIGRRHLAAELGADAVVAAGEFPGPQLGENPIVGIVTAPAPEALAYALEAVAVGGRVHAFAGIPGTGLIDANLVHYRHLSLVGSTGSRMSDYRQALDLAVTGQVDLGRLPTKMMSLEEVREALVGSYRHGNSKVLVEVEKGG